VFTSHYHPLPEVCAVGAGTPVDALPAPMKPGSSSIVNGNVPVPVTPTPAPAPTDTNAPTELPPEAGAGN
jgi:hypothetical protein